jgi:hypothetical protein
MRYVDAGYAVALVTLGAYAVSLVARRRRWERAYEASADHPSYPDPGLAAEALAADSDEAGSLDAGSESVRRERS